MPLGRWDSFPGRGGTSIIQSFGSDPPPTLGGLRRPLGTALSTCSASCPGRSSSHPNNPWVASGSPSLARGRNVGGQTRPQPPCPGAYDPLGALALSENPRDTRNVFF